jgi:uncharacterized protein YndB with AHSA1/START domain
MTVTNIHKDPEALTMTVTSEFGAPVDRVWQMWANPRLLERWWGPPMYPATVVRHDLTPGGSVDYFMTSPQGDRHGGWWRVAAVDAPRHLEFTDGFADEAGQPNPDMPVTTTSVDLVEQADGTTRMSIETRFPSHEAMERLLAMGIEEGLTAAVGQIDGLLTA